MSCDGVENVFIENLATHGVTVSLNCDQWLKCFQELNRSFETDRSWFDIVLAGRLGDDGASVTVEAGQTFLARSPANGQT